MTVDAMLEAAVKLLKRGGAASITTNRIAETAGVSIGSVYQYFPNKHALFAALHGKHVATVDEVLGRKMKEASEASLEGLVAALIDGMVEVHSADPELAELLQSEVPDRPGGTVEFSARFHESFREAIAPHMKNGGRRVDLDLCAFVMANLIESLGHAIVLRRPRGISLARAKAEACRAVLACIRRT